MTAMKESERSLKRSGALRQSGRRSPTSYGSIPNNRNGPPPVTGAPAPSASVTRSSDRGSDRGSDRLAEVRHQVDEVKGIMKDNIEKVIERDGKVSDLGERTENLKSVTHGFKENAKTIRRQAQWKSWKMTICIVIVVLVILGIITLAVLFGLKIIK